jgi:transcriptional regulator with XRE-family HTH domain
VSDLSKLRKFQNDEYRVAYLDSHVKGSIAYQIRWLREKLGLTQTQFGELVGMPQAVVSRLENAEGGAVNVNTLLKIANGLKIGLAIGFCNFETVLKSDVSPAGLGVESIQETINRLQAMPEPAPANEIPTTLPNSSTVEVAATWQTNTQPNHPPIFLLIASGTRNLGTFMQTGVWSN